MAQQPTPTIWPASSDPRVIVHHDSAGKAFARWLRRMGGRSIDIASHAAANLLPLSTYAIAALAAAEITMPTPAGVQPQQAFINFIVYAIIMIVAIIISVALAPKPPQPKPAALADFNVPTAEEGKPICKVFGEVIVKDPNVLWYGDLTTDPIKKKGGKK